MASTPSWTSQLRECRLLLPFQAQAYLSSQLAADEKEGHNQQEPSQWWVLLCSADRVPPLMPWELWEGLPGIALSSPLKLGPLGVSSQRVFRLASTQPSPLPVFAEILHVLVIGQASKS